jgi:D-3-phosphoglycerate dehydrogenase / 2-oxoglutarate reductase
MAQHDIVVTDYDFGDLSVERAVFDAAGLPLRSAESRDPEELARAAEGATVLLVQYAPITAALMDRLDSLELVVRYGVGVDGVDLGAAAERGIAVCNVVDYGTEEVAAHTAALLLAAWRHVPMLDRRIREGGWDYRGPGAIPRLGDSTLGLVGLGRIGRSVAQGLRPWFAEMIAAGMTICRDRPMAGPSVVHAICQFSVVHSCGRLHARVGAASPAPLRRTSRDTVAC